MNFLSNVEFATNNYKNVLTKLISFFVKHKYYLKNKTKFKQSYENKISRTNKLIKIDKIIKKQIFIKLFLKKKLLLIQKNQQKHANVNRQFCSKYKIKNLMYMNAKNFNFEKQSKFLNSKNVES